MATEYYVGLMSGTSADAIDAVVVDFSEKIELIGHYSLALPPSLRNEIHQLATPGANEIERAARLDRELGDLFADCVLTLLSNTRISSTDVRAIGSHGQTIRHIPPTNHSRGYSLQVGDPNIIAHATGITTVADFRRRDIAAGGQGAPLVPAFHRAIFADAKLDRFIINIGGIANITWLSSKGEVIGCDTGPGNTLMDAWINLHHGLPYDNDGDWAASGTVNKSLRENLLSHNFFTQSAPKSTGREAFNLAWLMNALKIIDKPVEPADVQATLLELTVQTIAMSIKELLGEEKAELFVCGGGAYNSFLIERLAQRLPTCSVETTEQLGIAPSCVEAMAFAWLARQTLNQSGGNLCSVTGATREVVLGGVYFA